MLSDMSAATLAHEPDLVIWPESAYPYAVPGHQPSLNLPAGVTNDVPWLLGGVAYEDGAEGRRCSIPPG